MAFAQKGRYARARKLPSSNGSAAPSEDSHAIGQEKLRRVTGYRLQVTGYRLQVQLLASGYRRNSER